MKKKKERRREERKEKRGEKKGMPCPLCGKNYLWDAEQDCYVDSEGKFCNIEELVAENPYIERMFCECGYTLAFSRNNETGYDIYDTGDWRRVDWMSPENYR